MEGLTTDLVTLGWIAVGLVFVGFIIAGANDALVIYFDEEDVCTTAGVPGLLLLAGLCYDQSAFDSAVFNNAVDYGFVPLLCLIAGYLFILNFINAINYNRSVFWGLCVGVFKLVFVVLMFFALVGGSSRDSRDEASFSDKVGQALVIALLVMVMLTLVNGRRVYKARGWELPEAEATG